VVHDKESALGAHASGRNSGVIHAGFYYSPETLKAQLTRRGNTMLRAFCEERGVPIRDTGKVVVTRSAAELAGLEELFRRGQANDVPLEIVDEQQLHEIEPLARTVQSALWSPTTASADPATVLNALARRVHERGGRIALGSRIVAAGAGWVTSATEGRSSVGVVVNAAGVHADTVAHWFGIGQEYRMLPFKGLYWYGSWAPGTLRRHVYPVPDARNPFLGVHLTVAVDGRVKVGPTAMPSLWRESYGGIGGFSGHDTWQVATTLPRFLTSRHHDVPALLAAELPKRLRKRLVAEAAQLVPSARPEDFTVRGRPGIRAQLVDVRQNRLEMDFVVRTGPGSLHLLNTVSPGWTTALAMAEHVVGQWPDHDGGG
jgi:L-2-hydroxyglutarate oxidase LhgO